MLLVERGKLDLAAPFWKYLPGTLPEWDSISIAQLLSHTSGIPDYFTFDEFDGVLNLTTEGIIEIAKKYPLSFEPGTDFEYSNTGYIILGKIIEQVSGEVTAPSCAPTSLPPPKCPPRGARPTMTLSPPALSPMPACENVPHYECPRRR